MYERQHGDEQCQNRLKKSFALLKQTINIFKENMKNYN
jgi:hypothetical protein